MTRSSPGWVAGILAGNEKCAREFRLGDLPVPPRRKLAVVTCMDARIDPIAALGLEPGDAHFIRNAGGRVTDDVIRSLTASALLLGVESVLVIHHTDCGMMAPGAREFRERAAAAGVDLPEIDYQTFADLDRSVIEDVQRIRSTPHLAPRVSVAGMTYDVRTGRLREVHCEEE